MYKIWYEKFSLIVKYVLSYLDVLQIDWNDIVLKSYLHISGTARTAVSFCGVILNNKESNRIYLSANFSTFLIAILEVGNLFCDIYR